jgi:threonine/homoserine/homoserine lactone efflux protein
MPAAVAALPPLRLYLRGVVLNLCNPKVILFFLALMPRFIRPEKGRVALQFILLGVLFIAATLIVFDAVAAAGGGLARALVRWPDSTRLLQRFSAIVLFGLAAWIAWTNVRK